eukprot:7416566-Pyramimonas_sp.AAC.1
MAPGSSARASRGARGAAMNSAKSWPTAIWSRQPRARVWRDASSRPGVKARLLEACQMRQLTRQRDQQPLPGLHSP